MTPGQKSRLLWACRRGMLEVDILLARFCERALDSLTPEEARVFERVLLTPDPELLAWLMGYETPLDRELADGVAHIQSYLSLK